jgi:hypothetical protein
MAATLGPFAPRHRESPAHLNSIKMTVFASPLFSFPNMKKYIISNCTFSCFNSPI